MADIFREVDEDLRRDRASELWKKYGAYVIGVALAVVLATLGLQLWQNWDLQHRTERSQLFLAAMDLAADDSEAALAALAELGGPDGGYGTLATFERASLLANDGRRDEALAIWDRLATETSGGSALQAVATLFFVMHQIDDGDAAVLEARLQPLQAAGHPFRPTATELTAVLALRQGERDRARELYREVADDLAAPPALRSRAAQMVAALRQGAAP